MVAINMLVSRPTQPSKMEIDEAAGGSRDAVQESTSIKHAAAKPVPLKEEDPFDLEQYIGQYAGKLHL